MVRVRVALTAAHPRIDRIIQPSIKVSPPGRREVEKIPDRIQKVETTLLHFRRKPRVRAVAVACRTVGVEGEDRNRGVLIPSATLTLQIVFESALARAQEWKAIPVPASR
jgi:hypothetical protein